MGVTREVNGGKPPPPVEKQKGLEFLSNQLSRGREGGSFLVFYLAFWLANAKFCERLHATFTFGIFRSEDGHFVIIRTWSGIVRGSPSPLLLPHYISGASGATYVVLHSLRVILATLGL